MDTPLPDYQQLMQMWQKFATEMASVGGAVSTGSVPSEVAKQMRDTYFQTLSQYTDQFMRSPMFLEMMKQATASTVTLRKQTNDFLAQAHHAVGNVARPDVDSLLMAVRRCETRVLDKLDEISNQLSDLESRLEAMESGNQKPSRKPRSAQKSK